MDQNHEEVLKVMQTIGSLISDGCYQEAVSKAKLLDSRYPGDFGVRYGKVAAFIDGGQGLKDVELVKAGVELGEALITEVADAEGLTSLPLHLGWVLG